MITGFIKNIFNHINHRLKNHGKNNRQIPDIKAYQDHIITDGILLNEIPSPTDFEELRATFIKRRLTEFGIDNIHSDDFGNLFVLFQGNYFSNDYLLVYTDMDNAKYSASESIVEIEDNKLVGIGIGDNSIGTSSLMVLCEYLKKNNIPLNINLIALFSLRNSPENNFEGIHYFLKQWHNKISNCLYLFGLNQGKLVLDSYGIYNISFALTSNNTDALGKNYKDSTVDLACQFYNQINSVNWEADNAIVNIVRISSGVGFEYFPVEGTLDIEIFSKDLDSLNKAKNQIIQIAANISKKHNYLINDKTVSYIPPSVDKMNHHLNSILRKIHKNLNIETKISDIPDYSSIINQYNIPTVTLGITSGKKTMSHEFIDQKNILIGFKQILSIINELNKSFNQDNNNG